MTPSIGDRIKLTHTDDQYTSLSTGALGTVTGVDTIPAEITPQNRPEKQIWVDWDSGERLALINSQDSFEIVNDDNKNTEQTNE